MVDSKSYIDTIVEVKMDRPIQYFFFRYFC